MLRGLRVGDAPLIQQRCAGKPQMFLRLGRLLALRLAFTEVALDLILAHPAQAQALTDPRIETAHGEELVALC